MLRRFGSGFPMFLAAFGLGVAQGTFAVAEDLELSLPIACDLGQDCFVQNYVDIDPDNGVRTAACNLAAYDGHKGTDFRVLNTDGQADVIASAPGIVKAVRNDMPDRLVLSREDRELVKDRECGNGLVIAHAQGWETQYCHLRRGSVVVAQGDRIERGQKLGTVGYSGFAAFPHVHLSVRKEGDVIDPFLGTKDQATQRLDSCLSGGSGALAYENALWQDPVETLLADSEGVIIQTGFADGPVKSVDLEQGVEKVPTTESPALVFFARLINLKKGDRVALRLDGPQGVVVETEGKPIDRQKAQWVSFAGRKLTADAWVSGEYVGTATLVRDGQALQEKTVRLQLED